MRGKAHAARYLPHWFLLAVAVLSAVCGCGATGSEDESPVPEQTILMPFGEIIADDVPARSGPGEDHGVLGTFARGEGVKVISGQGLWYQVRSERFSSEVWIYARFVHLADSLPAKSTPTTFISEATLSPVPETTLVPTRTRTASPKITLPPPPTASPTFTATLTPIPTAAATLPPIPAATDTPRPVATRTLSP